MKGNHRLIGVGRVCYAIKTKRSIIGMEIQWTLGRLYIGGDPWAHCVQLTIILNLLCIASCLCCNNNVQHVSASSKIYSEVFLGGLPLRLGGSHLTPSLLVRPHIQQKEEPRESDCWRSSYCGQSSGLGCLAEAQQLNWARSGWRTHTGADVSEWAAGQRKPGVAPVIPSLSHSQPPHYSQHCVLLLLHLS